MDYYFYICDYSYNYYNAVLVIRRAGSSTGERRNLKSDRKQGRALGASDDGFTGIRRVGPPRPSAPIPTSTWAPSRPSRRSPLAKNYSHRHSRPHARYVNPTRTTIGSVVARRAQLVLLPAIDLLPIDSHYHVRYRATDSGQVPRGLVFSRQTDYRLSSVVVLAMRQDLCTTQCLAVQFRKRTMNWHRSSRFESRL